VLAAGIVLLLLRYTGDRQAGHAQSPAPPASDPADGKQFSVRQVSTDREYDAAVLQIDAKAPLPFARLGDSEVAEDGGYQGIGFAIPANLVKKLVDAARSAL
jgi:S1-C subfamily serine protease